MKVNVFLDDWLVLGLNVPALVIIILCYVWFGLNELAAILAVPKQNSYGSCNNERRFEVN